MTRATARSVRVLSVAACIVLCGCKDYALQGRVVQGPASYAMVVDAGDPRLAADGIPGVTVRLQLEPGTLQRETMAHEVSDQDGAFSLPVDKAGAGFLIFEAGVLARRPGYTPAYGVFRLPRKSKRLLVMMAPGQDSQPPDDEQDQIQRDLDRFGR